MRIEGPVRPRRFRVPGALLAIALAPAAPAARAQQAPDLDVLLPEVRKVLDSDVDAWADFRFHRRVSRERLDDNGEATSREVLDFEITPSGDGFDEELVREDGQEPSPRDVRHYRSLARFTEHYEKIRHQGTAPRDDQGYSIAVLLHQPSYTYEGRVEVDGLPCHRLSFTGGEESSGGIAERLLDAMKGSLWISVAGGHVVKAEAETVRPVTAYLSMAEVSHVSVRYEGARVEDDLWLPHRIEVRTEARVLLVPIRKRNVYAYSRYRRVRHRDGGAGGD